MSTTVKRSLSFLTAFVLAFTVLLSAAPKSAFAAADTLTVTTSSVEVKTVTTWTAYFDVTFDASTAPNHPANSFNSNSTSVRVTGFTPNNSNLDPAQTPGSVSTTANGNDTTVEFYLAGMASGKDIDFDISEITFEDGIASESLVITFNPAVNVTFTTIDNTPGAGGGTPADPVVTPSEDGTFPANTAIFDATFAEATGFTIQTGLAAGTDVKIYVNSAPIYVGVYTVNGDGTVLVSVANLQAAITAAGLTFADGEHVLSVYDASTGVLQGIVGFTAVGGVYTVDNDIALRSLQTGATLADTAGATLPFVAVALVALAGVVAYRKFAVEK